MRVSMYSVILALFQLMPLLDTQSQQHWWRSQYVVTSGWRFPQVPRSCCVAAEISSDDTVTISNEDYFICNDDLAMGSGGTYYTAVRTRNINRECSNREWPLMCFSLQGCYDEVTDKFEEYSWIIIGVLAGIIVLQVWECFTPPFLVLFLHILIALHLPSTPSNPCRTVFNS